MKKNISTIAALALCHMACGLRAGYQALYPEHTAVVMPQGKLWQIQNPLPGLVSPQNIARLKADAATLARLLKKLDAKKDYHPTPVAVLAMPPHYNSTGINDAGVPRPFVEDVRTAYNFALGYAATGRAEYAAKVHEIADAWAGTLTTLSTKQSADILNFNLGYLVAAAALTRDRGGWDDAAFRNFLQKVALPASLQANPNNHGLWGIFMEASVYAYLADRPQLARIRERWQQHLAKSVDDEGVMQNEIQRSGTNNWHGGPDKGVRGLAYTHYALTPATLAAVIFENQGSPVWDTAAGARLAKAYHRAAAWARHPETFPYYASNGGKLEGVDSDAYFIILDKHYPDPDARWLIENGKIGADSFWLKAMF